MAAINPNFDDSLFADDLNKHIEQLAQKEPERNHSQILAELLSTIEPIDFLAEAYPESVKWQKRVDELEPIILEFDSLKSAKENDPKLHDEYLELNRKLKACKLLQKHYLIVTIDKVLEVAEHKKWGLCKNHDFIYLYNGNHWASIDKDLFQKFLGESAQNMGVNRIDSKYYQFRENLFKQFLATAYLPTPEPIDDSVCINLKNGTFEITPQKQWLRAFNPDDFLTYQLPFEYDPKASAPTFQKYLDRVLPDIDRQKVLAEYLAYVFIKPSTLKLEQVLLLYGTGANGKSVFFEVVSALLGKENVSSYTLQNLTDDTGYFRAKIANKLVNYASEINGNLQADIFKSLASGEPVSARLPYGQPFELRHYAKLIFNCNELPKEVEQTHGFFRRFLIVPFDETIPKAEQDPELPKRIIDNELSGVFNWVLDGLQRLLKNKGFTECKAVIEALERYKLESDSVKLFLEENRYKADSESYQLIKDLYREYRDFCIDDGFKAVSKQNFKKRLIASGVMTERKNIGFVAYVVRESLLA